MGTESIRKTPVTCVVLFQRINVSLMYTTRIGIRQTTPWRTYKPCVLIAIDLNTTKTDDCFKWGMQMTEHEECKWCTVAVVFYVVGLTYIFTTYITGQ